jgi:hypothetical protein
VCHVCDESYAHLNCLNPPCVMIAPGRSLDSVVMTMQAESRISHGLLVVVSWLTDPSTDVVLVPIVLSYHMHTDMTHS